MSNSQNFKEQPSDFTPAQTPVSDPSKEPDLMEASGETATRGEPSMAAHTLPVESKNSTV
jgi:hypothetical protein